VAVDPIAEVGEIDVIDPSQAAGKRSIEESG
jgi:hypothetical protein